MSFLSDWRIVENNDKLTIESDSISWNNPNNGRGIIESLFTLDGAFDIQIDFSITSIVFNAGLGIEVRKEDGSEIFWIQRGYWAKNGYGSGGTLGIDAQINHADTPLDSGKLRITRTLSATAPRRMTVYYWSGGVWKYTPYPDGRKFGETATVPLYIRLKFKNKLNAVINNFTINSGNIIESSLLYQINDGGDLYQINDAGDIYIVGG